MPGIELIFGTGKAKTWIFGFLLLLTTSSCSIYRPTTIAELEKSSYDDRKLIVAYREVDDSGTHIYEQTFKKYAFIPDSLIGHQNRRNFDSPTKIAKKDIVDQRLKHTGLSELATIGVVASGALVSWAILTVVVFGSIGGPD